MFGFLRRRPSPRQVLVGLALAAGSSVLLVGYVRSTRLEHKAWQCSQVAEAHARSADWVRMFRYGRGVVFEAKCDACGRRFDRWAAHFYRWEMIWRDAARHPWRAAPTPEPPPDS